MWAPEGFGVASTPWKAVQDAAWMTVKQTERAPSGASPQFVRD
jgi:hypothetical protein